jgi:hypothetical protein
MITLSNQQVAEYFKRSYVGVDGLWFMKTEERYDFDTALGIDAEVWKIVPKIQARCLKEMTGLKAGLQALFECFAAKLTMEGFVFKTAGVQNGHCDFAITGCPWLEKLKKAGREHLASRISGTICPVECEAWATEFGPGIRFEPGDRLCAGASVCKIGFVEVDK